ncbi:MAG: PhoH family protein [Deltaproteobacteria bacterium]|nr:PhoH family protein [Deltaproteobacteria bacterium]
MKRVSQKGDVVRLRFDDNGLARNLFGIQDQNLRTIEKRLGVHINVRGSDVSVQGDHGEVTLVERLLTELYGMAKKGFPVHGADVERAIQVFSKNENARLQDLLENSIFVPFRNKVIVPKGINQRAYMEVIQKNDLVFGIGPAGTGKTYLAVTMAVMSLTRKEVARIILSRPAVEAGEKLGFLPGDIYQKISPYLRPLYDALCEMMEYERVMKLVETGVIEVAPLAYMRGRTLNDSFIVLDEAQNCTTEQMKMFLTRLGFNSKAVVTGDVTQVDLPHGARSGLIEAEQILQGIRGIGFQYFDDRDVVRHPLVSEIVRAYDKNKNGMGLQK